MSNPNTYSIFPADADSVLDNQFGYCDYPRQKKGKKKWKKREKALAKLLNEKILAHCNYIFFTKEVKKKC